MGAVGEYNPFDERLSRRSLLKGVAGLAAGVAVGAPLLAACGSSKPAASVKKTPRTSGVSKPSGAINIFTEAGSTWTGFMKHVAPEFTKKTGVAVSFTDVPIDSMFAKQGLSLSGSSDPYDIMMMVWTYSYASKGLLVEVDDLVTPGVKSGIFPASLDLTIYNGNYYGFPLQQSCEALFINKDLLGKAGVRTPTNSAPWTWSEFLSAIKKMTANGVYGFGWKGAHYTIFGLQIQNLMYQAGVGTDGVLDSNGKVAINSPGGVEALKLLRETFAQHVVPPGDLTYHSTQLHELFTAGKLAVLQDFNYAYPIVNTGKVAGKIVTAPLYYLKRQGAATGGWSMTIPKNSSNIEAAKAWIKFVGTPAMDLEMAETYDPEPCWKAVFDSASLRAKDPWLYKTWGYMFKHASIPQVINAGATAAYTSMAGIGESVALGKISPEAGAKEMAAKVARELGTTVA